MGVRKMDFHKIYVIYIIIVCHSVAADLDNGAGDPYHIGDHT